MIHVNLVATKAKIEQAIELALEQVESASDYAWSQSRETSLVIAPYRDDEGDKAIEVFGTFNTLEPFVLQFSILKTGDAYSPGEGYPTLVETFDLVEKMKEIREKIHFNPDTGNFSLIVGVL